MAMVFIMLADLLTIKTSGAERDVSALRALATLPELSARPSNYPSGSGALIWRNVVHAGRAFVHKIKNKSLKKI